MKEYLEKQSDLTEITSKVKSILQKIYDFGFLLRRKLKL